MTLFEDLRQALRQICGAMGMSGIAATVVPLVVLGVALNIAALNAVESMRNERHPDCGHAALRSATRTELKVMRAVVVSTLKKIGDGQRRWCSAQGWMSDRQTGSTGVRHGGWLCLDRSKQQRSLRRDDWEQFRSQNGDCVCAVLKRTPQ